MRCTVLNRFILVFAHMQAVCLAYVLKFELYYLIEIIQMIFCIAAAESNLLCAALLCF